MQVLFYLCGVILLYLKQVLYFAYVIVVNCVNPPDDCSL